MINDDPIIIGGFVPLTTIDFPDHLSAVIFCQGCPLHCHYCHNPTLIPKIAASNSIHYSWDNIKSFLIKRVGLLEAVVFSGGEPTLQRGLIKAVKFIKNLGFKIGLHTAGIYPNRLKDLLPYLDWVGMDIKAPFTEYQSITTVHNSGKLARESVKLILASKVACEFRTTVHPKLLSQQQLLSIERTLKCMGAKNYKLQPFRPEGCTNSELNTYVG